MSRRAWAAFVAMAILWGIPYLMIRIAVAEVSPSVIAWARLGIAALVLLPIAASRGGLGTALSRWPWIVLLGAYYMALAFTLIPIAERVLPSSLTAIIIAGVPTAVTVINLRRDRPSPLRIAGLVLAFAGVAALVGLDIGIQPSQLFAVGCLLVVLVCYAFGPVMTSRKLSQVDPVATAALAAGAATLLLTPIAVFQLPARWPSAPVLIAIVALGLLCTALALVVWFTLINIAGPNRASIVVYINPVVAVIAGVLVLRERLGAGSIAGMVLILAGSWLATTGGRPSPRPAELEISGVANRFSPEGSGHTAPKG